MGWLELLNLLRLHRNKGQIERELEGYITGELNGD